jgi:poly(beta-D-mannuronate) lyase
MIGGLLLGTLLAGPARACDPAPPVVGSLAFGSRYDPDSATISDIDPAAQAAAEAALEPVEDFLRALTRAANDALRDQDADGAACVLDQLAQWADGNALADLSSQTAALTAGSRLAGFALVLMQVAPLAGDPAATARVAAWLTARQMDQITFWEEAAPRGARTGNLRAWAALAAAATAATTGDPALRHWAAWSATRVLCTANPDGSLPREMARGPRALQYQLHAAAPLVVASLLLDRQGAPVADVCDGALARVVSFALDDIAAQGALSRAITGEPQTFFDGTDTLEPFHLAFLAAWLAQPAGRDDPRAAALIAGLNPLGYSKLGGDQSLLWGG